MAARHRMAKRAKGGSVDGAKTAGGNPYVLEEAAEKKKGGKVVGKMHGEHAKHRLDRPGRKRGGRVGADLAPLSSANRDSKADAEPKSQTSRASHE